MHTSHLLALALSVATSNAVYQGFNYGSTQSDGSYKEQSDFQDDFKTAKSLVGTSGFTSARLYTMLVSLLNIIIIIIIQGFVVDYTYDLFSKVVPPIQLLPFLPLSLKTPPFSSVYGPPVAMLASRASWLLWQPPSNSTALHSPSL